MRRRGLDHVSVVDFRKLNFTAPDRTVEVPLTRLDIVELADFTIARVVHQPGWRWSLHVRPLVGGDWCRARHIGAVVSGRGGIVFSDGTSVEVNAGDAMDLPPLHDAWVIGEEPLVQIEFTGTNTFLGSAGVPRLATLLFTDIVDSTLVAARVGDVEWRELLADHYRTNRAILDRFGGSEVTTTGDGFLVTFESPASAIAAAAAMVDAANRAGLRIRAGVHVGEVQRVGDDVRGVAVHEAARIMATAGPDEIMVSDTTRVLAADVPVEDRGLHVLRGLDGERHLYAVARQSRT